MGENPSRGSIQAATGPDRREAIAIDPAIVDSGESSSGAEAGAPSSPRFRTIARPEGIDTSIQPTTNPRRDATRPGV